MAIANAYSNAGIASPAAETAILSCPPPAGLPPTADEVALILRVSLNITTGTTSTAVVIRTRAGQNTVTGALIGVARTITTTAGNVYEITIEVPDAAQAALANGFTVTVAETGATANGNVNEISATIDLVQV